MALAGRSRADNEVTGTVIGISGGGGGGGGVEHCGIQKL